MRGAGRAPASAGRTVTSSEPSRAAGPNPSRLFTIATVAGGMILGLYILTPRKTGEAGVPGAGVATVPAVPPEPIGAEAQLFRAKWGFVAAARSLIEAVRMSVYLPRNARVQLNAARLGGEAKALSRGEIEARNAKAKDAYTYTVPQALRDRLRPGKVLRLALRMLARDWRAGELTVLAAALVLAVGSMGTVGFLRVFGSVLLPEPFRYHPPKYHEYVPGK